ncbi:LytTR family transcriptional regulator DNA-binding domain-containing protein [Cytophagaceae bacterium YF14B1]|uniref:LytTR family transcriptional regulator DNA-binding domain-containing protein n=1 Tax=Xanthocytophaga flava TaxID=3048013 RepID=A0AAE3QQN6_9BACT|nr:LytTR family transcriptional regulator DNA-binding domain-containing protein [Xanthocytophaga flavus]MDJ1470098.1 LytTR family transcriptional regulator DNA-binding domain-containing protein [Xanthocytophaga flavus]MDJ1481361.1 LytTR family transcriptional regulator DNA-binding domain-containing protein [Xanthocytophaga flavus]
MTTILIDDEKLAISRLKRLLAEHQSFIDIVGEAYNGIDGLKIVEALQPDLIFLDIEMPGMNGFEMLAQLTYSPMVVFATAFDEYAIRAFEENSIDYLLKPIEKERLEMTIQKLRKTSSSFDNQQFLKLIEQMRPKKEMVSISVKTGDRILLLRLEDISYFEAEDKYTFLITTEGKKYLTDYTLTNLEEKLPDSFLRVSRSFIVNSRLIKEVQKHFSGKFILFLDDRNQSKIESGIKYAESVKSLINN